MWLLPVWYKCLFPPCQPPTFIAVSKYQELREMFYGVLGRLDALLVAVARIERRQVRLEIHLMATIDDLVTQLTAETDAEIAVENLYRAALDKIAADAILAGANQIKMDAAVAAMKANTDRLVTAALANTPAAP